MSDAIKFCKDCKWCNRDLNAAMCESEHVGFDLVWGGINKEYCKNVRNNNALCGRMGVWFEPKETK